MTTEREITAAEVQVVRLIASGLRPTEVAERLGKSPSTIRQQIWSARRSLSIPPRASVTALVAEARRRGLLEE